MKVGRMGADAPRMKPKTVNAAPVPVAEAGEAVGETETTEAEVEPISTSAMSNPDDTNVWPTAAEEAAFLSESRGRGEVVTPVSRKTVEEVEENAKTLPKLDELVERIPAETRELLDELFRAKFVAVRRVKQADFKK